MIATFLNYLSENRYVLPILITLLTLITLSLTLIPADFIGNQKIWSYDKLGHLLLFGSWTYLLGLYQLVSTNQDLNLFTIFFLGVSFGIAIEALQYLLPLNRSADFFDIAFDSLGSFIAVVFLNITSQKKIEKDKY